MSSRRGLAEPTNSNLNALRIGTVIQVRFATGPKKAVGPLARMMLSALVKRDDGSDVYALLTPHTRLSEMRSGTECTIVVNRREYTLGSTVQPESVLGPSAKNFGFLTLALNSLPLFREFGVSASQLVTTKGFRSSIWNHGNFKLRRVNDLDIACPARSRRSNRFRFENNKLGRVAGELHDVDIADANEQLFFKYCGLVSRSGGREIADKTALGAPLISSSGALSAIIVGRCDSDALVLPIENLRETAPLKFVTFGGDWPKVRVYD